ncbi:MAG TPA: GNAT family N-acetyltransferase [Acidimicrobiia bacterium]|nr:GNAT family N-acetyltransferase [Acidimicrobiia bacterium]
MSRVFVCSCGAEPGAADLDELVPLVKAHFDDVHPELGLTEASIRNYLEAEDRLTGPAERLERIGGVEIRAVGPDTLDDVLAFFDTEATVGNPAWAGCYCMFFPVGGDSDGVWGDRTWQENRADQAARITSGETTGVLAYVDGKLAGWCNATARAQFPGFATGSGDEGVGSIVCFAIAPPYRDHGVASHLLDGAVSLLWSMGFTRIEAYPVAEPSDRERAFPGSLALFRSKGFGVVSEEPLVVALMPHE